MHEEAPEDVDDPVKARNALSFAHCFFANRHSMVNGDKLAKRCMPHGIETDWAKVEACVTEHGEAMLDHFETITGTVAEAIKKDGLAVRIHGNLMPAAKTNFLSKVCSALEVRYP